MREVACDLHLARETGSRRYSSRIDDSRCGTAQANLDTTHFLRFNEVPEIDIALISTDNTPGK